MRKRRRRTWKPCKGTPPAPGPDAAFLAGIRATGMAESRRQRPFSIFGALFDGLAALDAPLSANPESRAERRWQKAQAERRGDADGWLA